MRPRLGKAVAVAAWAYLGLAVLLWLVLRTVAERWWLATLLLFGPRWIFALPAALLAPAALWLRRRSIWVVAGAFGIVVGPVMGLCLPWRHAFTRASGTGIHLRVLTCNTHGYALDGPKLAAVIDETKPDIVAMQEWDIRTGLGDLGDGPWYSVNDAELRVQSRYPIHRVEWVFSGSGSGGAGGIAAGYEVQTPAGPIRLFDLHLSSPHDAFSSAIRLESDGAAEVDKNATDRVREAAALSVAAGRAGRSVILCGDFNMPCDSSGYRYDLAAFRDAFSRAGWGFGWTYHHRGTATRIDHILTGPGWDCRRCWVGPYVGSTHRPLLADLIWQ